MYMELDKFLNLTYEDMASDWYNNYCTYNIKLYNLPLDVELECELNNTLYFVFHDQLGYYLNWDYDKRYRSPKKLVEDLKRGIRKFNKQLSKEIRKNA